MDKVLDLALTTRLGDKHWRIVAKLRMSKWEWLQQGLREADFLIPDGIVMLRLKEFIPLNKFIPQYVTPHRSCWRCVGRVCLDVYWRKWL